MTQPVELLPNIFAVETPKDAHSHEIYDNNVEGGKCIMFLRGQPDYACQYSPNLPATGNWSIIGVGISEEVAGKIVATEINGDGKVAYLNYTGDYGDKNSLYYGCFMFDTAIASLISLLKSKGLNPEDNYVFLTLNK